MGAPCRSSIDATSAKRWGRRTPCSSFGRSSRIMDRGRTRRGLATTRRTPGGDGTIARRSRCSPTTPGSRSATGWKKKHPKMTVEETRRVIMATGRPNAKPLERVVDLMEYRQRRNRAARRKTGSTASPPVPSGASRFAMEWRFYVVARDFLRCRTTSIRCRQAEFSSSGAIGRGPTIRRRFGGVMGFS